MALDRVKPAGFGYLGAVTSAEMNALDINVSNALDRTIAGDTVDGYIIFTPTASLGFQSGSEAYFGGVSTLQVRDSAAVQLQGNASITTTGSSCSAALSFDAGSSIQCPSIAATDLESETLVSDSATIGGSCSAETFTASGSAGLYYKTGSHSVSRCYSPTSPYGEWAFNGAHWVTTGVTATNAMVFALNNLPNRAVMTAATVYISPAAHTLLPAQMPVLFIRRRPLSTGSVTTIATVTDPANISIYPTRHGFSVAPFTHTIDTDANEYFAYLVGESSTNSAAGLNVEMLYLTFTITSLDA